MSRLGLHLAVALLCAASLARAQCDPTGRPTFDAGLAALHGGDLTVAAARFEELVKAQPRCAEARNNLAVVLVEQGRLSEAAEELRRAVALQPEYHRARLNLGRVETLLAARTPTATAEKPVVEAEAPALPAPTATASPLAGPPGGPPANIVALGPEGSMACTIDTARQRLCVYRRAADAVVEDRCVPVLSSRISSAPQWLAVSEISRHRMWLVDDAGDRRMKIVPDAGSSSKDIVRLRPADFANLVDALAPFRTACVVVRPPHAPSVEPAALAPVLRDAVEQWRAAWERKDFDAYVAQYAETFVPEGERDVSRWRAHKRALFEQPGTISVHVTPLSVVGLDDGATVLTLFQQTYRSSAVASAAVKVLRWQHAQGQWRISAETVLQEDPLPAGG